MTDDMVDYIVLSHQLGKINFEIDFDRLYALIDIHNDNPICFIDMEKIEYKMLKNKFDPKFIKLNHHKLIDHFYVNYFDHLYDLINDNYDFRAEWLRLFRQHPHTKVVDLGFMWLEFRNQRFKVKYAHDINVYEFIVYMFGMKMIWVVL